MSIKRYKPITPSLRNMVKIVKPKTISMEERKELKKLGLIKNRVLKHSGRNHSGKITVRHQGGGHKRLYRNIDRERIYGNYSLNRVERIDYNPSSSGFLALISPVSPSETISDDTMYVGGVSVREARSADKKKWYILAGEGMKEGDLVPGDRLSDISIEAKDEQWTIGERSQQHSLGQSLKLKDMIIGTNFYNLDGKFIRSAGTFGIILKHFESESFIDKLETKPRSILPQDGQGDAPHQTGKSKGTSPHLTMIKLPSGKIITISSELKATVGRVSNIDNYKQVKGKAGVNRWLGIRPTVRGEAMNPVDHPHGGKSHRSGGLGKPFKNKWGKLAKWVKTVKKVKTTF